MRGPSFIKWSDVGPELIIGTRQGNVLLYNNETEEKIPLIGKHSGAVTCGAWNKANQIVLGSADATITCSNDAGDTIEHLEVDQGPFEIALRDIHTSQTDITKTSLTIASIKTNEGPAHIYTFGSGRDGQTIPICSEYGVCSAHCWADDRLILGFSSGLIVLVSITTDEGVKEVWKNDSQSDSIIDVAYSSNTEMAAIGGVYIGV
eukprot:14095323-Ditylum_brightwellii.AAC.1